MIQKSLIDRHLVTLSISQSTLSIHRQLKQHILSLIEDSGEKQLHRVFTRVLTMVRKAFPPGSAIQGPTNHTWKECEVALPHVLSLGTIYETRHAMLDPSRDLATLLADAANYLWERGLLSDSQKVLEVGENVCDAFPGDPEIAPINANLCAISGAVHAEMGFSGRSVALEKCKKALELRKQRMQYLEANGRVNKEDGMLLSNGYNDLGVVSIQAEDWKAADIALVEALKLKKQFSTEADNPVQFGENYKNQAFVALAQGNTDEARHLAKRGHELYSVEIPEKSAAVQKTKLIHACILLNTGEIEQAKSLSKQVLDVRVELFGEKHHLVKDSMYLVGEIYRLLGKFEKAEKFFRDSLADSEASGFPLESVARSKYHLALAMRQQQATLTPEREKECAGLEADAKEVRDSASSLISDERKAKGPEHVHDFMVSLWSGRTVGMFDSWRL
jgi:tetratricopeptide (TPR) repeat protein